MRQTFPSVCTPQAQLGTAKHSRSSTTTAPSYSLKSVVFYAFHVKHLYFSSSRQPQSCYVGLRIRGVSCFVVMLYHSKHARLPISFLTALPSKNSRRQRRHMSAQANAVASQPCTPTLGIMPVYVEKSPAFFGFDKFLQDFPPFDCARAIQPVMFKRDEHEKQGIEQHRGRKEPR